MYYPYTVPIPSAQGVLVRKKKDDKKDLTRYVDYTYERRYDKNKKYSVPRKTVIGKVDPEDETRMYPNPSFFTYFPNSSCIIILSPCSQVGKYPFIELSN